MKRSTFVRLMLSGAALGPSLLRAAAPTAEKKKLVLISGKPSHGPGAHEFRAGMMLLERRLQEVPGLLVERHEMGWVRDEKTLDDAAAVVFYCDGGGGHPALAQERLALLGKQIQRGMGFGCMHYAVEVPQDKGGPQFKSWIGGYYEHMWSCNPMWEPSFESFPDHPIARGLKPFKAKDEWYFNMRFPDGFDADGPKTLNGVTFTPVLVAKPSDATREGPYVYPRGPYPHIQAAKGRNETMLWAVERPDGGRGFGFTGGHVHKNWQIDSYRRAILNALCWVVKLDIPPAGIGCPAVSDLEIAANLDPKR